MQLLLLDTHSLMGEPRRLFKLLFRKSKNDGRDPYLGILEYRTTPLDIGRSPSELLQGRKLRSVLSVLTDQLIPKVINQREVRIRLGQSHAQQKQYFDRQLDLSAY